MWPEQSVMSGPYHIEMELFSVLRDCHLRDNFHVTMRALAVMARYRNRAALRKEIKEVEELRTNQESKRDGAPTT